MHKLKHLQSDEFNFLDTPESFHVDFKPSSNGVFTAYLFGSIADPRQFINVFQAFDAADEGDNVYVNLSSVGGSLDATDTFLQHMEECKGRVIVRASGGCHSAASIILLNAPEFTLSDGFSCLIHCGSLGVSGTLSEFKVSSAFQAKHMESILRATYEGFLTEEEIDRMIDGKDFFLNAEEFMARYEKRNEYFVKLLEDSKE